MAKWACVLHVSLTVALVPPVARPRSHVCSGAAYDYCIQSLGCTTAEASKADVRNAFRVRNSNGDELQLAAIDRVDMDEWLAAVAETVADLRAAEDRVADQAERFKQESEN